MNALEKKYNFFSLIKFTIPTIIMMIFMSLYTMVDGMFVSVLINENALSSINLVYPAQSVIIAVSIMLATGSSAIIASLLGEQKSNEARENFTFIIIISLIIGLLFSIIGLNYINQIVSLLGASEITKEYCVDYLSIIILASPLAVLQMINQYLFVTAGKPTIGLVTTIIGGILNIVLDYIFIKFLNFGISGAAIATAVGYSIPSIYGLIYFAKNRNGLLYFVKPKINFSMLFKSCYNGSSEMITNLASSVTVFLFNMIMLKYIGIDGVAAITIVMYGQYLSNSLFMGYSSGVAPLISYNYGHNRKKELKKINRYSLIFISVSSLIVFTLSYLCSDLITCLFVDPEKPVYEITKEGFKLFSISYLLTGINIYVSALFTALSNGLLSGIISFLRTFLNLTTCLILLPMLIGEKGIWLSVPLAETLTVIISLILLMKYKNNYNL